MTVELEPVVTDGALLGEGPIWDERVDRLVWVDIDRHEVHRFAPSSGVDEVQPVSGPVAAIAIPAGDGTDLLAAIGHDLVRLSGDQDEDGDARDGDARDGGARAPLAVLPTGRRANDGACDPAGRFLIGTLDTDAPGSCALYRLESDGRVTVVLDGLTISNGLDWSPDGSTFYFADTPTERVDAFDYDAGSGTVAGRRRFADLTGAPGRPDGLAVDAEGGVWVAVARGSQLRRYDAEGRLTELVSLPVSRVTSCAFGGPNLDELYVTTAAGGLTETERADQPLAGALFRLRPGVRGKPPYRWSPHH